MTGTDVWFLAAASLEAIARAVGDGPLWLAVPGVLGAAAKLLAEGSRRREEAAPKIVIRIVASRASAAAPRQKPWAGRRR